tara:strand:- start:85 stop:417 length:333 start_codon:yes stop_codon:yes gene_type:complete
MLKGRTPSLTETLLDKLTNIRNDPERKEAASQGVISIDRSPLDRSNVKPEGGAVRIPTFISQPNNEPIITDNLQQIPTSTKSAGINLILPLMILGGFFAAIKLKKRKKNV